MKEFQVTNIKDIEPKVEVKDNNEYRVKTLSDANLLEKFTAAYVEIAPNSYAYGYHYHESSEEMFFIISGEGSVHTIKGEIPVKAGDAISFPTGEGGAHVIHNTSSSETLTYLDFGTRSECEIAHLPDAKKIMVVSKSTFGIFDEPQK